MRITKRVKKALKIELCLNDAMFELYRRQQEEIQRMAKRYLHDRRKIIGVLMREPSGNYRKMRLVDVRVSDFGTEVLVES